MYEEASGEEREGAIQVTFQNFEGPLDLLLFLVTKNKIDIYDIPIAEITESYLEYLQQIVEKDLNTLTAFHQMASKLMLIKSSMLLPQSDETDYGEIADVKTELIEKIIEYHKFKKLSNILKDAFVSSPTLLLRSAPQQLPLIKPEKLEWKQMDALSLLHSFLRSMEKANVSENTITFYEKVTTQQKKTLIYELLDKHTQCTFSDVVGEGGVLSLICSFLAVLDLLHQRVISALQQEPFGVIYLQKREVA